MNNINTPVSPGEVLDKITILEIKTANIKDAGKLKNVTHELNILLKKWNEHVEPSEKITDLKQQLKKVNQDLWNIEDNIRIKESKREFDEEFIQIARSVYVENDKRADVKKQVNLFLGSDLVEEKSYEDYS